MKASFFALYRQLVKIISCCLLVTTLTGIVIGSNNRLIQLPDRIIKILINLHQGAFLGDKLVSIYVLLLALGVFSLGLKIVAGKNNRPLFGSVAPIVADLCRIIGLALTIPLAICVETGLAYRLGTDWLGMSNTQTSGFLSVHGGDFFAKPLDIFYLLAVSTALISLLIFSQSLPTLGSRKRIKIAGKPHKSNVSQQRLEAMPRNAAAKNKSIFANRKIWFAIVCASIALFVLYYLTSASFVAIAAIAIGTVLFTVIIGKNLIEGWRQSNQAPTILQEQEAESISMLRAIPDSMLRVSQDGVCLSYMPAPETTSFVLYGDIVNRNINEFLAPEIAKQFTKSIESSLQTGSTEICRFSILDNNNNEAQYFEARVNPIGAIEVLILVREIERSDFSSVATENFVPKQDSKVIPILTESELSQVLKIRLLDINETNHILLCLAMYAETKNTDVSAIDEDDIVAIDPDLNSQVATQIHSIVPSSTIARLNDNDSIVLVSDCTMETASAMVNDLSQKIDELLLYWQNDFYTIKFKIALLEINADSSDVKASIDAAKTACRMARQKINLKTF